MKRALVSVIVILVLAGAFIAQSDAIFRSGKEQIKKLQREVPLRNKDQFCYSTGKMWSPADSETHSPQGCTCVSVRYFCIVFLENETKKAEKIPGQCSLKAIRTNLDTFAPISSLRRLNTSLFNWQ